MKVNVIASLIVGVFFAGAYLLNKIITLYPQTFNFIVGALIFTVVFLMVRDLVKKDFGDLE